MANAARLSVGECVVRGDAAGPDKQFLSTAHDRCFSLRVADREAEQPGSIPLAISYEQQLDVSSGSVRLNALWISGASARTPAILCAPTCFL